MTAPNPVQRTPVLVYDGDCAFCTRTAKWIARRLPDASTVQPWQALDLDALGLSADDVETAAWWVENDRRYRGHRAAGKALVRAGGVWRLIGMLLLAPPVSWLARPVYWWVAKNRYRMPGGSAECRIDERPGVS